MHVRIKLTFKKKGEERKGNEMIIRTRQFEKTHEISYLGTNQ